MAVKFENVAREILVKAIMDKAEEMGLACERIDDYASVAVEVVQGDEVRWMKIKVSAPKLADKDGNELWTIDDAMLAYSDRVAKDAEKEQAKAEKAAESARKKAERAAKAEVKAKAE